MPSRISNLLRLLAIPLALTACGDAAPVKTGAAGAVADVAAPVRDWAALAVAEAKTMPPGRPRDVTLGATAWNLREVDRPRAMEAARAMSDDSVYRHFLRKPVVQTQPTEVDPCDTFILSLKAMRAAKGEIDGRIRACFHMDDPPHAFYVDSRPFPQIMMAANALAPGRTKVGLLFMATGDSVSDRPRGGALEAVQRLRALRPQLDRDLQKEVNDWLETADVDLIEGKPDAAIARVRLVFRHPPDPSDWSASQPEDQAYALISHFLQERDVDRAVEVTGLLAASQDCRGVGQGLTGVIHYALPHFREEAVHTYLQRLRDAGISERLCPNGLPDDEAVQSWLLAGQEDQALGVASASGDAELIATTRLDIINRLLGRGDVARAKELLLRTAKTPLLLDNSNPNLRVAAANRHIELIHGLMRVGEPAEAERLAREFPGPGWRGFAYSVIASTKLLGPEGLRRGGPSSFSLQEVPAEF